MQTICVRAMLVLSFLGVHGPVQSQTAPNMSLRKESEKRHFGFDPAGMDTRVKPGEDFARYCNGIYLSRLEIPMDSTRYGMQAQLRALNEVRTRQLIENTLTQTTLPGSEKRKIADCYRTCMDEAGIEAKGLAPLKLQLDAIAAITGCDQISATLGRAIRMGTDGLPLRLLVRLDKKRPDQASLYISQEYLGLPNLVRNLDAWYQAFNVKPGEALYLPPENRIRIW